MSTKYTMTLRGKKFDISFATFFWICIGFIALYVASVYAAFNVIGWFALIFITICPISISDKTINPWPKYVELGLWIALIALAIAYLVML